MMLLIAVVGIRRVPMEVMVVMFPTCTVLGFFGIHMLGEYLMERGPMHIPTWLRNRRSATPTALAVG